jgi:hypothetical protein
LHGPARGDRRGDRLGGGTEAEHVVGSTIFVDGGVTLYPKPV